MSRDQPWAPNTSADPRQIVATAMTAVAAVMILGMAVIFVYIMYKLYRRDQVIPTEAPQRERSNHSVVGLGTVIEPMEGKALEAIRTELTAVSVLDRPAAYGVHKTLQVVFVLLGEHASYVAQWENVLILIRLDGVTNLTARIGRLVRREEKLVSEARLLLASLGKEDVAVAGEQVPNLWQWAADICQY